jgi:nitrous oxide reductase
MWKHFETSESYKDKKKEYETEKELEVDAVSSSVKGLLVNTPSAECNYIYFNNKAKRNMFNVGKIEPQSPQLLVNSPTLSSQE